MVAAILVAADYLSSDLISAEIAIEFAHKIFISRLDEDEGEGFWHRSPIAWPLVADRREFPVSILLTATAADQVRSQIADCERTDLIGFVNQIEPSQASVWTLSTNQSHQISGFDLHSNLHADLMIGASKAKKSRVQ